MHILLTYDVSTEKKAGRRRLRKVATACESYGQRVQKSVFECQVNQAQYEEMIDVLLAIINEEKDSLRAYRLAPSRGEENPACWGHDPAIDFEEDPLIF